MNHSESDRFPGAGCFVPAVSRLVGWVALGAILGGVWNACRSTHRRRLAHRADALPERLQTWEGEGGSPLDGPD